MHKRVTLLDYGVGNLLSVERALRAAGGDVVRVSDPAAIAHVDRLVVPGVGAFASCMSTITDYGLVDAIRSHIESGRPLLGICVGMQMLLDASEEFGHHPGLGVIPGNVAAIPPSGSNGTKHKIPHIGWTPVNPAGEHREWSDPLLARIPLGTSFYFLHSYTARPSLEEDRLADSDYNGQRISAVIGRAPVYGCQFHPEKSGPAGLRMLESFLRL